jgi:hypothetical protein
MSAMVDGRVVGRPCGGRRLLILNFGISWWNWLVWRSDGALRWKAETAGWEDRGVGCGKPTPPSL